VIQIDQWSQRAEVGREWDLSKCRGNPIAAKLQHRFSSARWPPTGAALRQAIELVTSSLFQQKSDVTDTRWTSISAATGASTHTHTHTHIESTDVTRCQANEFYCHGLLHLIHTKFDEISGLSRLYLREQNRNKCENVTVVQPKYANLSMRQSGLCQMLEYDCLIGLDDAIYT